MVEEARAILDQFSGNFVANYTTDINDKLDDIGISIQEEVGKVTNELSDLGLNSSLIPDGLYDSVEMYDSTISLVSLNSLFSILISIIYFKYLFHFYRVNIKKALPISTC